MRAHILAGTAVAWLLATTAYAASGSLLIENALVVDGTGAKPRVADVRVEGDRIVAVGALDAKAGETVVQAKGHALAPGFIDTHSHHDLGLGKHPDALTVLTQGVTTIIAGQDGGSMFPLAKRFGELEANPVAVNLASYVGHGTVRGEVMGEDYKRQARPEEIEKMTALVRQEMDSGALGLSSGLEYDPGIYASKAEVLTLAKESARAGGRYISHMRSEDREIWAALDEIIEIGRQTKAPVQVSHMKLAMVDWWGQAPKFIAKMDKARAEGVDITGDIYPYAYWQSGLTVMFPNRDFDNRASAEFALKSLAPPEGLLISAFPPDPSLVGKTIAQISVQRGTDPAKTLMDMIHESGDAKSEAGVIGTSMDERDIAALIKWPNANIISDGAMDDLHPRGIGSFPRVLRIYVRETHALSLEEAVRKMSGLAAEHMGLKDRGVIRPGAYADLVLFDPATVSDRATTEHPDLASVGIEKVWVNGALVAEDGRATGARPGRVLRRPAKGN